MSKILEVKDLSVNYGYVKALDNISFHVDEGEIVTLIGSNGAGKTSSLMSISNMIEGNKQGSIIYNGQDISNMEPAKIVKLGISHVPEGRHIFPNLSVEDNLKVGAFGMEKFDKAQMDEVIENVYQMFPRLRERKNQLGGTLSGGEQQMLAIGRGLIFSPKLLMLDEPSLGLAPLVVKEIFELILNIREKGTTILLIEQNAGMALQVADRAYVLENGSITLTGTGEELANDEKVIKAYLGM